MNRTLPTSPHSLFFFCMLFASLFMVCPRTVFSQNKISKKQADWFRIESKYDSAAAAGIDLHGNIRFEFYFSDADKLVIESFAERLEKDSFEFIRMYPKEKDWFLVMQRQAPWDIHEFQRREKKIKWLRYHFKVDHYLGFAIHAPDPDPFVIGKDGFAAFTDTLQDEVLFRISERMLTSKNYEKAVVALQEATKRNYRRDTVYYRLGQARLATKEYRDGVAAWRNALSLNPSYTEVHLALGRLLYENSYFEEALDHFIQADSLVPDLAEHKYQLAVTLLALKRYNAAYTFAKEILPLDRKHPYAAGLLEIMNTPANRYYRKKEAAEWKATEKK